MVSITFCPDTPSEDEAHGEYAFEPIPCETNPPIGSNLLAHLFHHPSEADVVPYLYRRIPKKLKKQEKGDDNGWGVQFIEGLDLSRVFIFGCVGSALAIVPGVYWSVTKDDIQSGFTISGFILGFIGFCIVIAQLDISLSNPVVHRERFSGSYTR